MYSRERERERERALKCQRNFVRRRGTRCNKIINTSKELCEIRKADIQLQTRTAHGYEERPGLKPDGTPYVYRPMLIRHQDSCFMNHVLSERNSPPRTLWQSQS
jgi:hypothetical protein